MTGTDQLTRWRPNPWLLAFIPLIVVMGLSALLVAESRVALWFCLGAALLFAAVIRQMNVSRHWSCAYDDELSSSIAVS